jgi:signal transduction histidine kinase
MEGPRSTAEGSFVGFVGTALDLTDERRRHDRLLMLAETSHLLAQAGLDLERVARTVVHRLAESVGHLCVLRLLTPDGAHLEPVSFHHRDPAAAARLPATLGRLPSTEGLLGQALQTKQLVWRRHLTPEDLAREAAGRPEVQTYLEEVGVCSVIVAPLLAGDHALGTLSLLRDRGGPEFTIEDRELMVALASRAAAAVENARLLRREQQARREAETANRLKDEFLATLSHELRTPLNAIMGWTSLLRSGELDPATRDRALATIARNARLQAELVDDVLDVSRIIAGQFRIKLAGLELGPVVLAALEAVRPAAQAKQVQIDAAVEPGLSNVAGDASRLQQVAWNLLSNAVKFTPAGGRVEVRLANGHGRVELAVSDTGIGIDPAFLPHVFERFRQGDASPTRAYGGLGLGLAIVRHIVELHGGSVEVRSEGRGRGATFVVKLPAMAITSVAPPLDAARTVAPPSDVPPAEPRSAPRPLPD